MFMRKVLGSLLAVGLLASVAHGATLVYYDLADIPLEPHPESAVATTVATGITAADITRGPGVQITGLTRGFSANEWNSDDPSRADSIARGKYYEFGLSVEPGYTVSLETLDMSLRRSATNAPMNAEVHMSLDGFETPAKVIAAFQYLGRTSGSAPAVNPLLDDPYYYMHSDLPGRPNTTSSIGDPIPTIDLSGLWELQNLPGGSTVTFRVYAWGNDRTTNTNTFAFGRVTGPRIGGTVTQ